MLLLGNGFNYGTAMKKAETLNTLEYQLTRYRDCRKVMNSISCGVKYVREIMPLTVVGSSQFKQ